MSGRGPLAVGLVVAAHGEQFCQPLRDLVLGPNRSPGSRTADHFHGQPQEVPTACPAWWWRQTPGAGTRAAVSAPGRAATTSLSARTNSGLVARRQVGFEVGPPGRTASAIRDTPAGARRRRACTSPRGRPTGAAGRRDRSRRPVAPRPGTMGARALDGLARSGVGRAGRAADRDPRVRIRADPSRSRIRPPTRGRLVVSTAAVGSWSPPGAGEDTVSSARS